VRAADHPACDKTRPAPNTPAKTLTLLALLALTLPATGKTCGTVVYKGKKTNIPCSVAIPNGKRPPPPKPTSNIVPPIQLPGDPPPAPQPAAPDPKLQALAEELALTNPDELTPRAAHELIYRWKQQLQNPKP